MTNVPRCLPFLNSAPDRYDKSHKIAGAEFKKGKPDDVQELQMEILARKAGALQPLACHPPRVICLNLAWVTVWLLKETTNT